MSLKRYTGGAWTDVEGVKRSSGGAWVDCEAAKKYSGGAWVPVWENYAGYFQWKQEESRLNRISAQASGGELSGQFTCRFADESSSNLYWELGVPYSSDRSKKLEFDFEFTGVVSQIQQVIYMYYVSVEIANTNIVYEENTSSKQTGHLVATPPLGSYNKIALRIGETYNHSASHQGHPATFRIRNVIFDGKRYGFEAMTI